MSEDLAGMLLLATPQLLDPNFIDSVVLLLDVADDGVLGVVLNRPTGLRVDDVLDSWADVVSEPDVLFHGGPVGVEGALAVALLRDPDEVPVGFRPVGGDAGDGRPVAGRLGLMDLETPVELVEGSLAELRIFAGYAGWDAEQLDGEIAGGSWYVVPAEAADAFRVDTADMWRDVLRRQPGALAWHTTRPYNPDLN